MNKLSKQSLNQKVNKGASQNANQRTRPNINQLSNPPVSESNNIEHLYDRKLRVCKGLITVDRFLLCVPLKIGSYIIAVISLIISMVSFGLVVHIIIYGSCYLEVYERKMDLFICLLVYLISSIHFMVTSIFLIIGTSMKKPIFVKVHFWGVVTHVLVNILNSLLFSIYCIVNNDCFQGTGLIQTVISFVFMSVYSLIWFYLASVLNSMLTSQFADQRWKIYGHLNQSSSHTRNLPSTSKFKRFVNQLTRRPWKRNVGQTPERRVNRPSRPNDNRTLSQPTNRPSSTNANRPTNQPVNRSPKRPLK